MEMKYDGTHNRASLSSAFERGAERRPPAVMVDYADDALLMTVDGAYVGKDAIQAFFTDQFNSQPITRAPIDHRVVENDTLLVEWSAESEGASLARAVDTYLIQGDKIIRHTTWFRWIPK